MMLPGTLNCAPKDKNQDLQCLPIVVGYDCSQSSDTYSVAHQMDFLTQEVFYSEKVQQQKQLQQV